MHKINNINIPSCRNCVHYCPNPANLDFYSPLNTCNIFGTKDIISNKIIFDSAIQCRQDESKCGFIGKEWKHEPNILPKLFWFSYEKNIIILKSQKNTMKENTSKELMELRNELIELKKLVHDFIHDANLKSREENM